MKKKDKNMYVWQQRYPRVFAIDRHLAAAIFSVFFFAGDRRLAAAISSIFRW